MPVTLSVGALFVSGQKRQKAVTFASLASLLRVTGTPARADRAQLATPVARLLCLRGARS